MWKIEFYMKDNGRCPVEEFIKNLNPKNDQPYVINAIRQLENLGYKLERPQAAHLGDEIFELRIKTINRNVRILYFFFNKRKIIMTNGFVKKSDLVPTTHLITAKEYRNNYYKRMRK